MIGTIIYLAVAFTQSPVGYLPADGRCLPIARYEHLAEQLHDGDNWPYGRCDNDAGFRLPDLRGYKDVRGPKDQPDPFIRVE